MTNSLLPQRLRWSATAIVASILTTAVLSGASAQNGSAVRSTIRDVVIGAPITSQPSFQEFACGTNGGPPSLPIASFADFATCPAESTGLHEVQFRYSDELHYIALAHGDALRAELFDGTKIGNFPIIASVLIDDAGIVRGVRAATDDRVDDRTRRAAFSMPDFLRSLYGVDGWECVELPAAEGEEPLGNQLVKQDCTKLTEDGLWIATQSRQLRRAGQTLIDPANGQLRPGLFESTARMEMYQTDASGSPIYGGETPIAQPEGSDVVPADPVEAFLAGATIDCPQCDLSGADLHGRNLARANLAGADLSGADLTGASLHRALLGSARLDGANLADANLNLADLKRATLVGADLTAALLYQADAAAADFSRAVMDDTITENARFTNAAMVEVQWRRSYGSGVNAAGADLTGAILVGTFLVQADLQRAILAGADITDVAFYRSRLRAVDFTGAIAVGADFLEADISDALFVNADLTGARLLRARSSGFDLTGAILTDTVMPDGNIGP